MGDNEPVGAGGDNPPFDGLDDGFAPVALTLMVGDFARVADGKLDVIGAGWDMVHVGTPVPFGVGLLVDIYRSDAVGIDVTVTLEDGDGRTVRSPDGTLVRCSFRVETTPAVERSGGAMTVPLAVNITPMGLPVGRYRFVASVDGLTRTEWSRSFSVHRRK